MLETDWTNFLAIISGNFNTGWAVDTTSISILLRLDRDNIEDRSHLERVCNLDKDEGWWTRLQGRWQMNQICRLTFPPSTSHFIIFVNLLGCWTSETGGVKTTILLLEHRGIFSCLSLLSDILIGLSINKLEFHWFPVAAIFSHFCQDKPVLVDTHWYATAGADLN